MKTFQIREVNNQWELKEEGQPVAELVWPTKAEAIKESKKLLKQMQKKLKVGISLKVCRADGTFEQEYTYTKKFDPKESKG